MPLLKSGIFRDVLLQSFADVSEIHIASASNQQELIGVMLQKIVLFTGIAVRI
jgi:hypothetical protein